MTTKLLIIFITIILIPGVSQALDIKDFSKSPSTIDSVFINSDSEKKSNNKLPLNESNKESKYLKYVDNSNLKLLSSYDTPEEIYNFTIKLQGDEKLIRYEDIFASNPEIPEPNEAASHIKEVIREKDGTSENISLLQAISLIHAGYKVKLITLPTKVEEGMRRIMFTTFYDRKNNTWRAMSNKKLEEASDSKLEFNKDGISKLDGIFTDPREFGHLVDKNSIVYSAEPNLTTVLRIDPNTLSKDTVESFKKVCEENGIHLTPKAFNSWVSKTPAPWIIITMNKFQMLPKNVLEENVNNLTIKFGKSCHFLGIKGPDASCYNILTRFLGHKIFLRFGSHITHEILHPLHTTRYSNNFFNYIPSMKTPFKFKKDRVFLDIFYNANPKLVDELYYKIGNIKEAETFATMGDYYLTSPHRLRKWLIKRLNNASNYKQLKKAIQSFSNYLFLKHELFNGREYGSLSHSSIWYEERAGNIDIHYKIGKRGGVVNFNPKRF